MMKRLALCNRGGFDEDSNDKVRKRSTQKKKGGIEDEDYEDWAPTQEIREVKGRNSDRKEEAKVTARRSMNPFEVPPSKMKKKGGKASPIEEAETEDESMNPFEVPPSKMTLQHFRIQHPFVNIFNDSVIVNAREDKVRDGKFMDDAALMAAILAMQPTVGLSNRAFKSPSSEIGGRPHHIALASGFWLVTEPHERPIFSSFEELEQMAKKSESSSEQESQKAKKGESSSEQESQQDLKITHKKVSWSGGESIESLDVKQEGDEGENGQPKVRYDFNFMIYDNTLEGSDTKVSALIVDATWSDLSMNKMCQVSSYGCKYAIRNMEKGRYAPLYVELWGEDQWRYGILYLKGIVVLEDGKVVARTSNCSSIKDLESTLQNTKRTYKQTIKSFTYPDGAYVESWLYIPDKKFSLPNNNLSNIEDIQCFYQSKIRIIAGDKALQWKEDEVKKRVATRLFTLTGAEDLAQSWKPMADNKRLKTR